MANLSPGTYQQGARLLTIAAITIPDTAKGVWVEYLAFTNHNASDRTVTIKDGGGHYFTAAATIPGTASSGGGEPRDYTLPEGGVFFGAGIVVTASTDNDIDMWIRYRNA